MCDLEVDAPTNCPALCLSRRRAVNAILIKNVLNTGNIFRCLDCPAVGEAICVNDSVRAAASGELLELLQRSQAEDCLHICISLGICARKRIERANSFPNIL